MCAAAGLLLVVATPQLPRDAAIICWLSLASAAIGYVVYEYKQRYRRRFMTDLTVLVFAAVSGLLAGAIALYLFPSERSAGAAATDDEVTGDLMLDFRSGAFSHGQDNLVMQPVIATNRSPKRMSLSFTLALRTIGEDGHDTWHRFDGYWNGTPQQPESGKSVLNLDSEASQEGRLVFRLVKPSILGIPKWDINGSSKDCVLEIHERVIGRKIGSSLVMGYPPAIDCPPQILTSSGDVIGEKSGEAKKKLIARSEPLDLKFRSTAPAIFPFNRPDYSHILLLQGTTFVNHSDRNMSLRFTLLARNYKRNGEMTGASAKGQWREGDLVPGVSEGVDTLNIPRDSTVEGTLIFQLHDLSLFEKFYKIEKWEDIGFDKMTIRAEDLITGRVVFLGMSHYPPGVPFSEIK